MHFLTNSGFNTDNARRSMLEQSCYVKIPNRVAALLVHYEIYEKQLTTFKYVSNWFPNSVSYRIAGSTALHAAVKSAARTDVHDLSILQAVLENADRTLVNDFDGDGETVLHIATDAGREDIIELILCRNCDVNIRNKIGDTALHIATRAGRTDIVELILCRDCDVNIRNVTGKSVLHIDRKSTRLNSSHNRESRMPSSA